MTRFTTSSTGFELIKAFEGFRADAAPLANGGWVLGYGHSVSARRGGHVSRKDASDLLIWDVKRIEAPLCDLIYAPLSQNQFDALVSLVFNIGLENFQISTVLRRLNEGCPVDAAAGFDDWRRARLAGQVIVVDALVRRRTAEKALFLSVPGASVVAPTPQIPPLCDPQILHERDDEVPLNVAVDLHGPGEAVIELAPTDPFIIPTGKPVAEQEDAQGTSAKADFVPLDEALNDEAQGADPVAAIAEKVAGQLQSIAPDPDTETSDDSDDFAEAEGTVEVEDTAVQMQAEDSPEHIQFDNANDPAFIEDVPHLIDEEGLPLEPYEADQISTDNTFGAGAPLPFYDEYELAPGTLESDAPAPQDNSSFQPARDRGRGVFIVMGIVGIIMGLFGLWHIQATTGEISGNDVLAGPGLVFLGALFLIVSVYSLLRRLKRK